MNSFALLAIRPLKNCADRFRKVLKKGIVYPLDYNYHYHIEEDVVTKITYVPSNPASLYNLNRPDGGVLPVNVSAVVGRNGSGKSTLLELLFLSIYVIANKGGILKDNLITIKRELAFLQLEQKENENEGQIKKFQRQIKEQEQLFADLALEIFYTDGDNMSCIRIDQGTMKKVNYRLHTDTFYPDGQIADFDLKHAGFFYSIAINYSLYGLNSSKSGDWLEALFHKNDGYQTPIVINPLRTDGDINVNSELHLAQSRLLANLMDEEMTVKEVLENKPVRSVTFQMNEKILEEVEDADLRLSIETQEIKFGLSAAKIFAETFEAMLGHKIKIEDAAASVIHFEQIVKYTIKKLFKISIKYFPEEKFHTFINDGSEVEIPNLTGYLAFLKKDRSHITLKLRQILNCVRFNLLREDKGKQLLWQNNKLNLPLAELESRISSAFSVTEDISPIEMMPVAFYRPSFIIGDETDFHSLSSGEQQLVHTTQSILYHLINLNTVFNNSDGKLKFKHINLILDEVELYFHPDFQKRIISDLLSGIEKLSIPHIEAINILFSTHSPFILSDIPKAHILKLDEGMPSPSAIETFGANIHEMLADSFFLKDGFMGDFAKRQISEAIKFIETYGKAADNKPEPNRVNWTKDSVKELIALIGEPMLKRAMEDLYYSNFSNELDLQIDRLLSKRKERDGI